MVARSPNHWPTREVPGQPSLTPYFLTLHPSFPGSHEYLMAVLSPRSEGPVESTSSAEQTYLTRSKADIPCVAWGGLPPVGWAHTPLGLDVLHLPCTLSCFFHLRCTPLPCASPVTTCLGFTLAPGVGISFGELKR